MAYVKLCLAIWLLAFQFIYCDDNICGEGEHWIYGYYPEATCDNIYPEVDLTTGTEGCFCLEDYVRDSSGKCIPVSSCPVYSDIEPEVSSDPEFNELEPEVSSDPEFNELEPESSSLPEFEDSEHEDYDEIENYHDDEIYPELTNENVSPGHDNVDKCGKGEVFRIGYYPEATCDNMYPEIDPNQGVYGCFCIEHYVRDSNGTCIPKHQCFDADEPYCCGVNEYYGKGLFPERTCDEPNPLIQIELVGCYCNNGYIRNEYGVCIPESESKLDYILRMKNDDEDDNDGWKEYPINLSDKSIRD